MSGKPKPEKAKAAGDAPRKKKSKLVLLAPVGLVVVLAGLWFGGILPPLLGMGGKPPPKVDAANLPPPPPTFVDLPELVANLDTGVRRVSYIKLKAKVQLAKAEDAPAVTAAMPRLQDMFNTFLRQMRPDELRGSLGTWRLHEELLGRANVAVAPAHITDVLFVEMLIQ